MNLDNSRPRSFSWKTKTPGGWRHWAIAGTTSATSGAHIDCSGLGTWVHNLFGKKFWIIGHPKDGHAVDGENLVDALDEELACIKLDRLDWTCIEFLPGDQMLV